MPQNTRKILIFSTSYLPHIGGAEMAIKGITDQLTDCEFDLITARCDDDLATWEKIGNVNVFRVGNGGRLDTLLLPIRGLRKAVSLHKEKNYNLIFALMASQGGLAAARFKKLFPRVPFLLNLQEGRDFQKFNPVKSRIFKRILATADLVTVISEHLKQIALQNGVAKHKIRVIPNGVDLDNFGRDLSYGELSELGDRLGIKPDEKVIITASRLTHKNGLDDLIRALALLIHLKQSKQFKLIIAGEGEDRKKLTTLVKNLNISGHVVFTGTISSNLLPKYLRMADIFVRPSRSEGLGSAFLEAMAAGLPIIGTRVGGIPDFLKDGETGLFCRVNDPESIATKIEFLIKDTQLQHSIIKEAYRLVAKNYDWKKIAGEYRSIFESLA